MHEHDLSEHAHHHDAVVEVGHGERRTRWVVTLTLAMMIAELVVGWMTGSMALLADGWHMATHAGALGLTLAAYWYARVNAGSDAFSFGTGKVYALAGYTSGVVLAVVALWMGVEAAARLLSPSAVDYGDALPVAILGLVVNAVCAKLLGHSHAGHDHGPAGHDHAGHDHGRDHEHAGHDHDHAHADHDHGPQRGAPAHDHNLRAAYLHVLADALTSVLAIAALLAGKYLGWWFLDPAMGILGGVVIMRWSIDLCRQASRQLLDAVLASDCESVLKRKLEAIDDVKVADLHVWELGPGRRGCIVSLVTSTPRDTDYYRTAILGAVEVAHLTVEVHRCSRGHGPPAAAA
jgi:cation diffusion facilitator family transporter